MKESVLRGRVLAWAGITLFVLSCPQVPAMTTASRTSGVAPLAVFFDAVDTVDPPWTSGVVQPSDGNYANLHYVWNFGDPGAGVWPMSGRSRNEATGCVTAHVYEQPGEYWVTLTVKNTTDNLTHVYTEHIVVSPFSGTTYYVSTQGDDANSGTSETLPLRTFEAAMSKLGTNVCILFRAGESWTCSDEDGVDIDMAGPGIIGSYGVGDAPVITYTGRGEQLFQVLATDWRIMNLSLAGTGAGLAAGIRQDPAGTRLLLWNLKLRDFASGALNTDNFPQGADPYAGFHRESFVVGCDVGPIGTPATRGNGLYLGGGRTAVLGVTVHDFRHRCEHGLRVWYGQKYVISHNRILDPMADPPKLSLKLHALGRSRFGPAADTRHVVISDNTFRGCQWTVALAPQDALSDEHVHDVVFERNTLLSNSDTQAGVFIQAERVTLRNNLIVGNGGSNATLGFILGRWSPTGPVPTDIRILNNTLWRSEATDYGALVQSDGVGRLTVQNNIVSLGSARYEAAVITGTCQDLVADHNLLHRAVIDLPIFQDPDGGDFRLRFGSVPVDAGADVPGVFADFVGVTRPQGAAFDLGAYELGADERGYAVCGTLTLQDYLADVTGLPVTVGLRGTDGRCVTRTIHLLDGDGNYRIDNVTRGEYDVAFKASHWLRHVIFGVAVHGDVSGLNASLINGDVNDDNRVDMDDYYIIDSHWGQWVTPPGAQGDLNGDGLVWFEDSIIWQFNSGKSGPVFEDRQRVVGAAFLQGFLGDRTTVSAVIELRNPGDTVAVESHTVTLASDGSWSFLTDLSGTYDVWVRPIHWLSRLRNAVHLDGVTDTGTMEYTGGDVNGDNQITFADFAVVQNNYGGTGRTPATGDVNGDGRVTFEDFALLQNVYGQRGKGSAP